MNLEATDLYELYQFMTQEIVEHIVKYQREGSGWALKQLLMYQIHTVEYHPLRGSSYIKLPIELAAKKNENDNKCFLWCITRYFNPIDRHSRQNAVSKVLKQQSNQFNCKDIVFPVTLKNIDVFEEINPTISMYVFGYEGKSVYPLRISKYNNLQHIIDLLLITEEGNSHYCLISNIRRLLSKKISNHKCTIYIHRKCMNPFFSEESYNNH